MLLLRRVWQRDVRPILTVFWELLPVWIAVADRRRRSRSSRGSPVLAKAAGLLRGSPDSASPPDRRRPIGAGVRQHVDAAAQSKINQESDHAAFADSSLRIFR